MAKNYTYPPLGTDQIRLVQLLPSHNNEVHIKLVACSLTEVAFDALSYSWGAPAAYHTIDCEGHHMEITPNLLLFLQSLLRCSQILPLWIDAISIDHSNNREKGHTLSQMPVIYHTARRTLCWTGSEPGIIGSLSPILDVGCYQRDLTECLAGADILHSTYKIHENHLSRMDNAAKQIHSDTWRNLDAFLDQTYFNRIWIIQDVVCSREPVIFDGEETIHWTALSQALFAWLFFSSQIGPRSPATMFVLLCECMRNRYLGLDDAHATWPELLLAIRNVPALSREPSDYVYLVYSMANGLPPSRPLRIDYRSSAESFYSQPVIDYGCSTELAYSRASEGVNVLSGQPLSLSLSDGTQPRQPSWSTNWETRTRRHLLNRLESGFSASRQLRCENFSIQITYPADAEELPRLQCTGHVVDSIRRTSDYLPPRRHCDHYILKANCYFFDNWYEFAQENSRLAEDTVLLDYADTIQARGCGHLWEDPSATPRDRVQKVRAFLGLLSNEHAEESDATNSIRLFHAACFPSHDRRFAVTNKGRFCLVPEATKSGDLVCIPCKSRVPYIFRPRPEGDGYQNVGETYVHGMMHGEMGECEASEETEFLLY